MGEEVGDKDNDEFDGGLDPEEAIEFLKLVEQARAEASPEEEPLEELPETAGEGKMGGRDVSS